LKFKPGDETDRQHCIALQHEFLRCRGAFTDFCALGCLLHQHNGNAWLSYRAYNAYSRFIHHLYEFVIGSFARDVGETSPIDWMEADARMTALTQRLLSNKRTAILSGAAPPEENDLGYYPERVPHEFATELRQARNSASAHVTHKRAGLSLSDFFERNHKLLLLLYRTAEQWWGRQGSTFPDLDEITAFSLRVQARGKTT
jgi:hypothetical protein